MKKKTPSAFVALGAITLGLLVSSAHAALKDGMKAGNPEIKSMSQLAFGPEGILFVADTKSAAIIALDTGDTKPATSTAPIRAPGINQTVAALTGIRSKTSSSRTSL